MNTVIIVIIALCIVLGYYAWRQQQRALVGLKTLKNSGVTVTFAIHSRPLLVMEGSKKRLYLIDGSTPQSPVRLNLSAIKQLRFIESPPVSNNNTAPRGSDTLIITLYDGSTHRIGDLPDGESGAKNAMRLFEQHQLLNEKLIYQPR